MLIKQINVRNPRSMYHLNIIGNGRITLSLLKMIFDNELDRYINKITVWCRERKTIFNNKVITIKDNVNEEIIKLHLMQKEFGKKLDQKEGKIEFRTLESLDDLVNLNSGPGKGLLILALKYNLDELIYIDKTKKERIDPKLPSHFELLLSRMKVILPGIGCYQISRANSFKKKILGELNQVLKEKHLIHELINELSQNTSVGYTRLYNLEHSVIGVKYLSQVLRNYNGLVFNMVNEVDTINSILHKFSCLKPNNIISPCENDTIRAKYFLRNSLRMKGINVRDLSLSYIGPHNHAGFIPPETVRVDGKILTEIIDHKTALSVFKEVTEKVNNFGEEVYMKKGSSDEDTIIGIRLTLASLFENTKSIVRVSCYDIENDLFTGLPGFFENGQFIALKNLISNLSQESRKQLFIANNEQNFINQRILSVVSQL